MVKFVDFMLARLKQVLRQSDSGHEKTLTMIGCREWCRLDELNAGWFKARIVTGCRTSVLYVSDIRPYDESGQKNVEFTLHCDEQSDDSSIVCHSSIFDQKEFKGPDGYRELRWIIQTSVSLGESTWTIPLAITSHKSESARLILGRTALEGMFLVDASKQYLSGKG